MLSSEIRAADYRAKAREARVIADCSALLQVRRRHEAAEGVWLNLAALEDRRGAAARQKTTDVVARSDSKQALRLLEPL